MSTATATHKRPHQFNLRLNSAELAAVYRESAKHCLRPQDYIRQILIMQGKNE